MTKAGLHNHHYMLEGIGRGVSPLNEETLLAICVKAYPKMVEIHARLLYMTHYIR